MQVFYAIVLFQMIRTAAAPNNRQGAVNEAFGNEIPNEIDSRSRRTELFSPILDSEGERLRQACQQAGTLHSTDYQSKDIRSCFQYEKRQRQKDLIKANLLDVLNVTNPEFKISKLDWLRYKSLQRNEEESSGDRSQRTAAVEDWERNFKNDVDASRLFRKCIFANKRRRIFLDKKSLSNFYTEKYSGYFVSFQKISLHFKSIC